MIVLRVVQNIEVDIYEGAGCVVLNLNTGEVVS